MSGGVHGKGGRFKRKEVGEDRESVPGDVPGPPPPPEGLQLPSLEGLAGVTIEVVTSRVKENRHRGARSAGRGNVNKYRTRVAFRVHDSTSGAAQSVTYDSRRRASAAEDWVPPVKKTRGPKAGSVAGQCACTSMCATRLCPCKAGGVVCTDKCLRHALQSCRCVNRGAGAPQHPAPVVPGARLGDGVTLDPEQEVATV